MLRPAQIVTPSPVVGERDCRHAFSRHGEACPGHPRLGAHAAQQSFRHIACENRVQLSYACAAPATWMAGTSPGHDVHEKRNRSQMQSFCPVGEEKRQDSPRRHRDTKEVTEKRRGAAKRPTNRFTADPGKARSTRTLGDFLCVSVSLWFNFLAAVPACGGRP